MKIYVIAKCPVEQDEIKIVQKPESVDISLPNEKAANLIMNAKGFSDYVAKHGYHFTEALAQVASDMMINSNGIPHKWTPEQIKTVLDAKEFTDYKYCTLGDLTYLSNMAYADFYPNVIRDEMLCIKYAMHIATDPDGYDGIVFSRWIADLIGKHVDDIDWENFI